MADFPKDFFAAEERNGFYIESMMKCAWAAQIEVMEVFDALCSKHNLRYFATFGTLLGAVRHKGFIPWDDDMDIFMFREDYTRLLHLPAEELPPGFAFHSIYENSFHKETFARMVNSSKIDYSPEHLARFHGCPYIVGFDIFPLDTLTDNPSELQTQCQLLRIVFEVSRLCDTEPDAALELLPDIEALCNIRLDRERPLKNQLLRIFDNLCRLYNNTSGPDITCFSSYLKYGLRMKKEWFAESLSMPFETIFLPVPAGWQEILTAVYGDWKTPVQGGSDHDYPFWKKQEQILAECMLRERNSPT